MDTDDLEAEEADVESDTVERHAKDSASCHPEISIKYLPEEIIEQILGFLFIEPSDSLSGPRLNNGHLLRVSRTVYDISIPLIYAHPHLTSSNFNGFVNSLWTPSLSNSIFTENTRSTFSLPSIQSTKLISCSSESRASAKNRMKEKGTFVRTVDLRLVSGARNSTTSRLIRTCPNLQTFKGPSNGFGHSGFRALATSYTPPMSAGSSASASTASENERRGDRACRGIVHVDTRTVREKIRVDAVLAVFRAETLRSYHMPKQSVPFPISSSPFGIPNDFNSGSPNTELDAEQAHQRPRKHGITSLVETLGLSGGLLGTHLTLLSFPNLKNLTLTNLPFITHDFLLVFLGIVGKGLNRLSAFYPLPLGNDALDNVLDLCPVLESFTGSINYFTPSFLLFPARYHDGTRTYLDTGEDLDTSDIQATGAGRGGGRRGEQQQRESHPLRSLALESPGGLIPPGNKISADDIIRGITDGRVSRLREVRCSEEVGWRQGSSDFVDLWDLLDDNRRHSE